MISRQAAYQLTLKDFRSIWREKRIVLATLSFSLLLVVVSTFAFRKVGFGSEELRVLSPGILWLVFLFAGVVGLNHSFGAENENRALSGLLISPVDLSLVYLSKFFSNFIFLVVVQVFALIVQGILFGGVLFPVFPDLVLLTLLAGVGFVSLGTLLSAISVATNAREILLPILLFPLSLPLLIAAINLTHQLIEVGQISYSGFWFVLICVFDIISLTLSTVMFEFLVRE